MSLALTPSPARLDFYGHPAGAIGGGKDSQRALAARRVKSTIAISKFVTS
jgi:hypothetical protein